MSFIPALIRFELETFLVNEQLDAHGNPVDSWAEPVEHFACLFYADNTSEPDLAGHDRVVTGAKIGVPEEIVVGPHDRVSVRQGVFEVVGDPGDYRDGPWWNPGVLMYDLQRIVG